MRKLPDWLTKIEMIEKGFTEREFEEEFTLETLGQLAAYHGVLDRVREAQERKARSRYR